MKYISILLVLSAVAASAGNTGTISGIVSDMNGRPVNGALVVIKGANLFTMSNADGYFAIMGVPVGYYTVNASRVGYSEMTLTNVRVIADTRTNVNYTLGVVGMLYIKSVSPLIRMNKTRTEYIYEADDFK